MLLAAIIRAVNLARLRPSGFEVDSQVSQGHRRDERDKPCYELKKGIHVRLPFKAWLVCSRRRVDATLFREIDKTWPRLWEHRRGHDREVDGVRATQEALRAFGGAVGSGLRSENGNKIGIAIVSREGTAKTPFESSVFWRGGSRRNFKINHERQMIRGRAGQRIEGGQNLTDPDVRADETVVDSQGRKRRGEGLD